MQTEREGTLQDPLQSVQLRSQLTECWKCKSRSRVRLFATLWPVACQAPLPMGFSRQEYWSGLLFPPPGILLDPGFLLDPGIEAESPALQVDSLPTKPPGKPLTPK